MPRCDALGPQTGWRCAHLSPRPDHHSHTAWDPQHEPRGGQDPPFEHWADDETDDVTHVP